jgi:pyridoxamine 5'-phosphate oxidase
VDDWILALDEDPFRVFAEWFAAAVAAGIRSPETMTVATATIDGRPSARMVLLKGASSDGFDFYTNRDSRKGSELAENPRAALVLYWQALDRQVRIEGAVSTLDDAVSFAYFSSRPRGARIAAWSSPQSQPIADREALLAAYAEADARLPGEDVPLPPFWGGYRVVPDAIEFWESRENRVHDRVRYTRSESGWTRSRLGP